MNIRLDLYEFADAGAGTYSETVRLVELVGIKEMECPPLYRLRRGETWDWRTVRRSRNINWRRLPDGRVELNGIGIGEGQEQRLHNTIATLPGGTLNVNYATTAGGMHVKPYTREPKCEAPSGEGFLWIPFRDELRSVPIRLVEWSLGRKDAH